jgi:hypothetical protein
LILDHHEGYIGWAEFERNQRLISDNANGKSFMSWGSVRRGEALLAGLLRLHVTYSGTNGSVGITAVAAISTTAARRASRSAACGSIAPSVPKLIERVQPLGIEAAIGAMEARHCEAAEKRRQVELALEQARYDAAHARRQYAAVDPDNRLVAAELERRWNERLLAVHALKDEQAALATNAQTVLTASERERLLALGADVERAWHSPGATATTRKRIVRTLIEEIIVRVEDDTLSLSSSAGTAPTTRRCACARTARVSTAGGRMRTSSSSSRHWPGRCPIRRSPPCSTGPARGPARAMAGPGRACACWAIIVISRPIGQASAPSEAR